MKGIPSKIKAVAAAITLTTIISSCSMTGPVAATSNAVGSKVGESSTTIVFGFVFGGDASIRTAARNGGITKISTVDVKTTWFLPFFATHTCIITGE